MDRTRKKFEEQATRLANALGCQVESFERIPEDLRDFMETIGHVRVCSFFVLQEIKEGRSETRIGVKYCLTRRQIQLIKERSKKSKRAS